MMTLPNQTDLDRRYDEYRTLCCLEGMLPVGFAAWIEWDRDVYQPHIKTAATPLSPATYQKMYGNKTMDEHNKKDNLSLIITYQDRVALLEEQLRVTEAELKLTQQERENYYNRMRIFESVCATKTSKIHELQTIGNQAAEYLLEITKLKEDLAKAEQERGDLRGLNTALRQKQETMSEDIHSLYKSQLAAKDKEIYQLKNTAHAKYRPTLTTFKETSDRGLYPATFRCLPQDVRVGDMLADGRDEWRVTNVVPENDGFRIECSTDFVRFCPNEPVCLHSLAPEGVPYDNLVDKTALEEAKKLITRLTEDRDEQERRLSHYRELYDCLEEAGITIEQVITHLTSDLVTIPENTTSYPHYFKALPKNVTHVDVYWVLQAWSVSNPAVQHAVKKMLCTGNRGVKDKTTDLEEARDSLNRAIELEKL